MPAGRITLVDAMQHNLVLGGVVDEVNAQVPEIAQFPITRVQRGLKFTSMFMKELPTTGFRKLGDGIAASKGRYEEREFKLFLFAGRVEVEIAAGQADDEGLEGLKARHVKGVTLSALKEVGSQVFYGVANEADGFPGLKAFAAFGGAYTLDATGSTSNTASSVYGVKFGEDYASMLFGATEDPFKLGEFRKESLTGNNGALLPGEVADLEGWLGLAIKHAASVVRICNLTAQTGKGLTDALAGTAEDLLPAGIKPDVYFMSKRSRAQLRTSRSTPENVYPAMPTELNGVPIIVTDSILNTDAIEA
jgi:hypothetical protein